MFSMDLNGKKVQKNAEKIANLLRKDIFDAVIATLFFNRKNSVYDRWLHWPRLMEPADIMLDTEVQKKSRFVIRKEIYHCPEEELMTDLRACNGGDVPGSVFICGMDTDGAFANCESLTILQIPAECRLEGRPIPASCRILRRKKSGKYGFLGLFGKRMG